MINPFGLTKTEVAIFEMGETSGWSMGVRAERERIIKLLEKDGLCVDTECNCWDCMRTRWQLALIKGEK